MSYRTRPCAFRAALMLAVGALVTGALLLFGLWRLQPRSHVQAFVAAERLWSARPFQRYRLVTEQQGGALQPQRCRQEIEVHGERIVTVAQNTCLGLPLTITDLLDRIDPYVAETTCGPNGCACDGYIVVDATYDAAFGYPRFLHIGLYKPLPWLRWPFQRVSCTLIGFSADPDVTVISVTPLP